MSEMCYRCFKPKSNCLCPYIKEADPKVKFVILMHPKEAFHQRTGTGRITALALKDSEILIGVDFSENKKLNKLLEDEAYYPVILYPGKDADTADSPLLKQKLGNKTLLVIVVDATWPLAAKIVRLSKNLKTLPKLSFRKGYTSQFKFKHEPQEECLSTIESCYYLIKELQEAKIADQCDIESMLIAFTRMVDHQLESERQRKLVEEKSRYHHSCKK